MVDIESDGPIPGDYSMIALGAVLVNSTLDKTFFGKLRPISEKYLPDALKISGYSREETLDFDEPLIVMLNFENWIKSITQNQPIFISDNNGFDWMFVCWYCHHFLGRNIFGFSSQNLGSFYKGIVKDTFKNFKYLRKTTHTHHPVDDAKGNAEALLEMIKLYDIKTKL